MDLQYVRDTARTFIRCAEAGLTGAKAYTPRGEVTRVSEFLEVLGRILPASRTLIKADGKPLPVAFDFDDSALQKDLPGLRRTPLEEGVRETADIFARLQKAGNLDSKDLEN
jgi:nucleoside-diphosphate-sugar epimerase